VQLIDYTEYLVLSSITTLGQERGGFSLHSSPWSLTWLKYL